VASRLPNPSRQQLSNQADAIIETASTLVSLGRRDLDAATPMFAGPLLWPGDQILSSRAIDLATQFVYWRQFGFEHLRAGTWRYGIRERV
jgi:hypothetical protein